MALGPDDIKYIDRETGAVLTERVFGGATLEKLYRPPWRLFTDRILTRRAPSRLYGWLQRRRWSARNVAEFVRELAIDATEAEHAVDQYATLDAFFTRRLRPGARPLDADPSALLSPADGRTLVYPDLADGTLPVKGARVTVTELLGDALDPGPFVNGTAIVVRLAPADYHRFHFPADGIASTTTRLPGPLHSVHPIALAAGAPSFVNLRHITRLETRTFGELALVEVGALLVGSIVQTYTPGQVHRGQEKGYFRFGGSTVVVLAARGAVHIDEDLIRNTTEGLETFTKMGTRLGTAETPA